MTTREKIIVGIMCLTIVYGAYELLFARGSRKTAAMPKAVPTEDLSSFVAEIGRKLNTDNHHQSWPYIITQAATGWTKDPFMTSTNLLEKFPATDRSQKNQTPVAERPDFIYSGYLQMGDAKIAIINGLEYAVGEALPDKTFYVKQITPARVVLARIDGAETIQIPIRELEAGGQK